MSLWFQAALLLIVIFTPISIQLAHFGTTESLLMFFTMALFYVSFQYQSGKYGSERYLGLSALILGLAIGTKVSMAPFLVVPIVVSVSNLQKSEHFSYLKIFFITVKFVLMTAMFALFASPYNVISFSDFLGSMHYESGVGTGTLPVFYTQQFQYSVPLLFQAVRIFPYALGWPIFLLSLYGVIFLPWKSFYNLVRLLLVVAVIPAAFLYAKWTRFIAPAYPLMVLLAALSVMDIYYKFRTAQYGKYAQFAIGLTLFISVVPGVAFLSIYQNPDVRFQASAWMYRTIPRGSNILSETANTVDLPIPSSLTSRNEEVTWSTRSYVSFNFYDLQQESSLQQQLRYVLPNTDVIVVPTRRVFANYTCIYPSDFDANPGYGYNPNRCDSLRQNFPLLTQYYTGLFNNLQGFQLTAEFHSYPRIELFGLKLEFPDEAAEETFTVFDHPVVRVYTRINN
ncbi:hypothetical protein HGB07_05350 [Candidatus Roizmanbacteria bacterium]|nr:hypothetical protein [Candidatus Roizmanbacteria bacterium]